MGNIVPNDSIRGQYHRQREDATFENLVIGEAKEAVAGLDFRSKMFHAARNILVTEFGNPQAVVEAQLKKVFSQPPVKLNDPPALIRYSTIQDSCVNVLTSFQYDQDLHSESVVSGELKWFSKKEKMQLFQPGLAELSQWLSQKSLAQEATLRTVGNSQ